jgi:hypothetical protein
VDASLLGEDQPVSLLGIESGAAARNTLELAMCFLPAQPLDDRCRARLDGARDLARVGHPCFE